MNHEVQGLEERLCARSEGGEAWGRAAAELAEGGAGGGGGVERRGAGCGGHGDGGVHREGSTHLFGAR